jgi:hypothetical protein
MVHINPNKTEYHKIPQSNKTKSENQPKSGYVIVRAKWELDKMEIEQNGNWTKWESDQEGVG